jgi:hypothetical protein
VVASDINRHGGRNSDDSQLPLIPVTELFEMRVPVIAKPNKAFPTIDMKHIQRLYQQTTCAGSMPKEYIEAFQEYTYVYVPSDQLPDAQLCICLKGENTLCRTGYCYLLENEDGGGNDTKCTGIPECKGHRYLGTKVGGVCFEGFRDSQRKKPCRLIYIGLEATSRKYQE